MSESDFLRSLAQNNYMINNKFLDTGKRLNRIAETFDRLVAYNRDLMEAEVETEAEITQLKASMQAIIGVAQDALKKNPA